MSSLNSFPFSDRLRMAGLFLACWLAVLLPWGVIGGEGCWWMIVLFVGSAPVALVGAFVTFVSAARIAVRPIAWAAGGGASIVVLVAAGVALYGGGAIGLASAIVAGPAGGLFMAIARWKPLWWPTDKV